jgi:hypothetical protein
VNPDELANRDTARSDVGQFLVREPLCESLNQPLFVDNQNGFGLVSGNLASERIVDGLTVADLEIQNKFRFWLGIVEISGNGETSIRPDTEAGIPGLIAETGFLPPCESGFTSRLQCDDAGITAWIASTCGPGNAEITFALTPNAASLTLADAIMGDILIDLASLIQLANDLDEEVPSFRDAVQCFRSNGRGFACAGRSMMRMLRDRQQLDKTREVLLRFGVNLTLQQVFRLVFRAGIDMFQAVADYFVLEVLTGGSGQLMIELEAQ